MTSGPDSLEYRVEQFLDSFRGGNELLARCIAFQVENGCEFRPGDFRVRQAEVSHPLLEQTGVAT